jgi:acetylornithine deacetylase/succinyl-diaminopimelate desuccinylase-like protein
VAAANSARTGLPPRLDEAMPSLRERLCRLVRIPSISGDPAHAADLDACARATAELLAATGAHTELWHAPDGPPAVYADLPGPHGAPTVLLYAHYDVQPPGADAAWAAPPFEPCERDGRLYGRGAADDKAGILIHLAAVELWHGRPPCHVKMLIEGEEEVGSPNLSWLLDEHGNTLAADVMVLADSLNWQAGIPALTTSARGDADVVVALRTLANPVHEGVYGGPVPDALSALARVLASLHDDAGAASIDGLPPATPPEQSSSYPTIDPALFRAEAGLLDGVATIGRGELHERLWLRPAVSVLAIDAPAVDGAINQLAPTARARISLRIPPGMDAEAATDALERHLRRHAPWGAAVTVTRGEVAHPARLTASAPVLAAAEQALTKGFGTPPVRIGLGGTLSIIAPIMARYPAANLLLTGIEDPQTHAHAQNESLNLADFRRACLAEALLLHNLSQLGDQIQAAR